MNSLDWRFFASHELEGLASDFDLTTQPTSNPARHDPSESIYGDRISDQNERSDSPRQGSENYSVNNSENTNMASLRSCMSLSNHLRQKENEATSSPLMAQNHVSWKGNPTYSLTWEALGILVSLCFLVLGASVAHLKGQQESAWSLRILQATRIAPSLWPVLFSGVLGNAVRALADWRIERGVDLLTVEQLMGSLTLFNAVTTIFKWSILRLSSIAIVLLWAFNPLGSQSSFRGIYLQDREGSSTGSITSYNYNLSSQLGMTYFVSGSTRATPKMRALYSATLYDVSATTQYVDKSNVTYRNNVLTSGGERSAAIQVATDVWGNVRVPNLQALPEYDRSNPHKWLHIPWQESVQNYSGLVGERIEGVQRNIIGDTSFNITSSYQTFECSPWMGLKNFTEANTWMLETFDGMNFTTIMNPPYRTTLIQRSFFVAKSGSQSLNASTLQSNDRPQLLFGTLGREPFMSVTGCSTRMTYVDMQVDCKSGSTLGKINCGVSSIRETLSPTDPAELTLLESERLYFPNSTVNHDPQSHLLMERGFMDLLDDMQSGSGSSSFVEWYLRDPLTALNNPAAVAYTDLGKLDIKLFEQRFSLLWNTLWKLSLEYESIMSGNMTQSLVFDTLVNTTSVTTFPLPAIYAIDLPWMTLYFVSVAVMFCAAVFSLVMHHRCHAPPLLGYISSLLRDSKYFDDSKITGNSVESGTEKTKRLRHLRVLVGDTKEGDEVGKLALVPVGGGVRVKRKRLYE